MNRRDFIKTAFAGAFAGLVALVLPKGKRDEPDNPAVTYADVDALFKRPWEPDKHELYLPGDGHGWPTSILGFPIVIMDDMHD